MNTRSVALVLVDRANYGRLKPVAEAIHAHPKLALSVVAAGSMVLPRFGRPVEQVCADGLPVEAELYLEVEGSSPTAMARSVGLGIIEFSSAFDRLAPEVVVIIGDRYEALAAAVAATYQGRCVVHLQGGEQSGSLDESARHAITKLAHFHVPATEHAKATLLRLGESRSTILAVGCPSVDLALSLPAEPLPVAINETGSGADIALDAPYLLAAYHPDTSSFGREGADAEAFLAGLEALRMPTVLMWPNIDAGADRVAKTVRHFRQHAHRWLRTATNLPPREYLSLLRSAAVAVGNSSSFVREAALFGTPVVLVGGRQQGRERGAHALTVPADAVAIEEACRYQVDRGRYAPDSRWGTQPVSPRLAEAIATLEPYRQKRLAWAEDAMESGDKAVPELRNSVPLRPGRHT